MSRQVILGLFLAVAAAQIAVPVSMIARHETVLREGRVYKFKTAPVDPADAFRGRYVALGFEENSGPATSAGPWVRGLTAYIELAEDSEGFAHISRVSLERPEGSDYVKAKVAYSDGGRVYVTLPFDRYYMSEAMAPQAEQAYREHSRGEEHDAYVTVRVQDGSAVIEGLYVDGVRIEEFVRGQVGS